MMDVGVVMTGGGSVETGGARDVVGGRIMDGTATGAGVEPMGSIMALAWETKGGIDWGAVLADCIVWDC